MSIKELLTRILGRIGSTTFSLTVGVDDGYGYGVYDKATNTVRLYFWARGSISAATTILTVPSGYRPSSTRYGIIWIYVTNRGYSYHCTINTDGTIKQGFSNSVDRIAGFAEYQL